MIAAIYCRVSTDGQEKEGTSLASQRDACIRKAQELGYSSPGDYAFLEVWTGADTDRPKLNELRRLVKQHSIDCIVCYSTDRLARNPIHIAIIAEECEKSGVDLVFVTEPLDNSPEGELIRYVRGFAAQIEREKIRERTIRGKREKARSGLLATGGARLFGYNAKNGRRTINVAEAAIVTRIFTWFSRQEYTLYRAAAELNRTGLLAPRGGRWSENTVHRLVINPAYKGVTYAFRYKVVEPKNPKIAQRSYKKTTHVFRNKEDWIEIPGATPAIVEPTIWEMAQNQLQRNRKKSPRNRKHQYLLTNGRLRCGVCGRAMVGSAKKKVNKDWLFYRCVCNVKSAYYLPCSQRSIAANRIEPLVWKELTRVLKEPELVLSELEKQRDGSFPASIEAEEILVGSSLRGLQEEERRYLRLYGQGRISERMLFTEVDRVKYEANALQGQLRQLKERRASFEQVGGRIKVASKVMREVAARVENSDYETKQLVLEALDIQVVLQQVDRIMVKGSIPAEVQLSGTMS